MEQEEWNHVSSDEITDEHLDLRDFWITTTRAHTHSNYPQKKGHVDSFEPLQVLFQLFVLQDG